ncbi:ATP-dependent zinc protease [Alkalilimnicola ehrlichii MLHE-1]|uniref:Retropepsin-like aspartic endopeptidase domain-containing protein n=1 Tax=Alkalilimnicola ehrlichii (strain ATCC BAA-1101 / DSM 17681 / MLHE-1) TaxID=187272 RepID=Q0AAL2_ALKEH|nr:ATP-dependent zinc protease [Alkalilimnicola ehrlichii]ABI56125.1 protein of unknown function DUF785 [Alkalilimnicola ehrlichii MLHE-1]
MTPRPERRQGTVPRRPALAMLAVLGLLAGCQTLPQEEQLSVSAFEQQQTAQTEALLEALDTLGASLNRQQQQLSALGEGLGSIDQRLTDLEARGTGTPSPLPLAQTQPSGDREDDLEGKVVLGAVEWLAFPEHGMVIAARVDSGAASSSLNATGISEFERDGETWVRFTVSYPPGRPGDDDEEDNREVELEAPLDSRITIRQAAGREERLVVRLPVRLGPIEDEARFTLSDRGHLTYATLVGRDLLMDIAVIDVAETYLHPRPEDD